MYLAILFIYLSIYFILLFMFFLLILSIFERGDTVSSVIVLLLPNLHKLPRQCNNLNSQIFYFGDIVLYM